MDWITTSGKTLDEAKSNALDQLGIVADEAEFDIINDVEKNFLGRVKTEAKVRTRVRPKQPAVKDERRRRNGKGRSSGSGGGQNRDRSGRGRGRGNGGNKGGGNSRHGGSEAKQGGRNDGRGDGQKSKDGTVSSRDGDQRDRKPRNENRGGGNNANRDQQKSESNKSQKRAEQPAAASDNGANAKKENVDNEFSRGEQEQVAVDFLEGVLDVFGMSGSVALATEAADDNAIELGVTGEELGLLVGQKGATLNALQELTRTVVQREADGAKTERLRVDVGGYRARRSAALQDFARKIAADVVEQNNEKVMEPMGSADRKIVHDALTDIDGVETGSEGEEPRRRVVIRPV
ncbi:MAG: RNA-binding cell elongation regulator Jag/EloR [Acidimicrobiales bacterium]